MTRLSEERQVTSILSWEEEESAMEVLKRDTTKILTNCIMVECGLIHQFRTIQSFPHKSNVNLLCLSHGLHWLHTRLGGRAEDKIESDCCRHIGSIVRLVLCPIPLPVSFSYMKKLPLATGERGAPLCLTPNTQAKIQFFQNEGQKQNHSDTGFRQNLSLWGKGTGKFLLLLVEGQQQKSFANGEGARKPLHKITPPNSRQNLLT